MEHKDQMQNEQLASYSMCAQKVFGYHSETDIPTLAKPICMGFQGEVGIIDFGRAS